MKLLLRDNVDALGRIGDMVEVAPGYARNYLIPQGLAMEVTTANLVRMEKEKTMLLAREDARKQSLSVVAKRLAEGACTITMAAGDGGHLYGSVNARVIADALIEAGYRVEAKMVLLDEPIRELGVYENRVRVRLHPEIDVPIRLWVVEEAKGAQPAPSVEAGVESGSEAAPPA